MGSLIVRYMGNRSLRLEHVVTVGVDVYVRYDCSLRLSDRHNVPPPYPNSVNICFTTALTIALSTHIQNYFMPFR